MVDRNKALTLLQQGNYLEALVIYDSLLRDIAQTDADLAHDFQQALVCYQQVQRIGEIDAWREEILTIQDRKWRLQREIARSYFENEHYGFIVAGVFVRGDARGSGQWSDSTEFDRVRGVQIIEEFLPIASDQADPKELAEIYFLLSRGIELGREADGNWKFQALTDFSVLPEIEPSERWGGVWGRGRGWGGQPTRGAPVDDAGNPIFYPLPASWEEATNDGQRHRWAQEQAASLDPDSYRDLVDLNRADTLMNQFGVQTMASNLVRLTSGADDAKPQADNPFAVSTLSEEETIARLATGIKRFQLPDEFNHIQLFQDLAQRPNRDTARAAMLKLASVFENRQQYPKAAQYLQQALEIEKNDQKTQMRLDQIIKPWGMFETALTQPADKGASVEFRFRNAKQVQFKAQRIDQHQLLADTMEYLRGLPDNVDWSRVQLEGFAHSILQDQMQKYLIDEVANWSLDLNPRPNHFDRRITVQTPLQKAGAYLLTAEVAGGKECSVVIWVADTAIVRKQVANGWLYMVADAITGQPIANCDVEFFGWNSQWDEQRKRTRTLVKNFAEKTDQDGFVQPAPRLLDQQYQWVAIARTDQGRLAFMGFSSVWRRGDSESRLVSNKAYAITDRPIYRPSQTVKYKVWMRQVGYELDLKQPLANSPVQIIVNDSQGKEILNQQLTTDQHGGFDGEFELPTDASLGNYTINVSDVGRRHFVQSPVRFRVEEYKKPEFEVAIEAPPKPLPLGEKIPVTIRADYYFGGAVTDAVVRYKVQRTIKSERWFPIGRWDWLYGNGYLWLASDNAWYPGFGRWGCLGPIPSWWGFRPDPPEVVLDEEGRIGEDGTLEFEIDTAIAKALHGDQDHEYSITAEVVDASRRTIVGSGSVIVSHQPFKVHVWSSRGYSRVGQFIDLNVQARSADGVGISGQAKMVLYQIQYDQAGVPRETELQSWDLATDDSGALQHRIAATEAGQFRISVTVTDEKEQAIEGGQLLHVVGQDFDSANFRYNDLEVLVEKAEYQPGDKLQLLLKSNQTNARLLVWVRPSTVYQGKPIVVNLEGKSATLELDIKQSDMPNFFVEVTTVFGAKVHEVVREVFVPPANKMVEVELLPESEKVLPGAETTVQVKLTDPDGQPFTSPIVMTMYDRALEYISGGSNVPDIRAHFWNWKRSHYPRTEHTLGRIGTNLVTNYRHQMAFIGIFGSLAADTPDMRIKSLTRSAGGRGGTDFDGAPMALAASAMADSDGEVMEAQGLFGRGRFEGELGVRGESPAELVEPVVRTDFADAAYWNASLEPNSEGIATATIKMPENLTSWKIRTWALGPDTSVGEATAEIATAKNIMVRMQAPRFFVEKDQVVLSAIVHNYLDMAKQAEVSIELSGSYLKTSDPLMQTVEIPAGGSRRVNWLVTAQEEGEVDITMAARTDVESDAMRVSYPVLVHGMLKTESYSQIVRSGEDATKFEVVVPEQRRPEMTRLEIRYSPTLAGAMIDALPYLNNYPYGCTEQTLNRFLPTVITLNVLQRMQIDLEAIQEKRINLNPQEIGDDQERRERWQFLNNPVFDVQEVMLMAKVGVADLTKMQNRDGGWGWFSGTGERSWPHTTATVVRGLQMAKANDIALVPNVLENGFAWLQRYQDEQIALLNEGDRAKDRPADQVRDRQIQPRFKSSADNLDALVYLALAEGGFANKEMADYLYRDRGNLSLYGKALVGLAFDLQNDVERRDMLIRNISQFVKYDDENQSAFIDLPNQTYWWFWYGDSIEANAMFLKLMAKANPEDRVTAGLVKYLINNRRHGTYWKSTRDTALCVEAFADFILATGEDRPEMKVEVLIDGNLVKEVEITPENLFTFDNKFVIEGPELETGTHEIEIRRQGTGNLYSNAYMTNFTKEDFITAAGLEIKVQREFYRLEPIDDATAQVAGDRGQVIDQKVERFRRIRLENWAEVRSGDLIEIELEIDSKNDYEYVMFEDMKAAGCEPVELRSGYVPGSMNAYVEFRDQRVAFFTRVLSRGKHSFSYRLRAEIPGKFSALPTKASAMYAPELRANSDEMKLKIADRDDLGD